MSRDQVKLLAMVPFSPAQIAAAIEVLPDALQSSALRWFERLAESRHDDEPPGSLADEFVATLTRLVAYSEFAANTSLREWPWLIQNSAALANPPDTAALRDFGQQIAACDDPIDTVQRHLRRYRNCFLLHLLWREVAGVATVSETIASLSKLADELVDAAAIYSQRQLEKRFGVVRDEDGDAVPIVILGMGKLGGRELNFSSDIDLILLFSAGRASDGNRSLSPEEYFTRVSRQIIALLDEPTADGFVFRVDTRLRPFGDSGPQVVSFAALESYLLQHGRGWERYAYVKARIIVSSPSAATVDDLYGNLILPFVYRRYLDYGVFESLREMHALIAAEVQRRDLADNVKLGPGGIREIEFIVQSLQLVRGGSDPRVQGRELQEVLPKLVSRRGLRVAAATELGAAYTFLRRLENFIQGMRDQATHDLPVDETDRMRLCLVMGYTRWADLLADLGKHRDNVSCLFDEVAFRGQTEDAHQDSREGLRQLWDSGANAEIWVDYLTAEGYREAGEIAASLVAFCQAPPSRKIDTIGRQRLRTFVPILLLQIKNVAEPARTLRRTLTIVEKIMRRSAYLALLNENQPALSRLLGLCEKSAYIADQIARYPVLLDELLELRSLPDGLTRAELESDWAHRLAPIAAADSEAKIERLCQFQRANMFHIAVADFDGALPIMKVSDALTALAEVVLEIALQLAWDDLSTMHGLPGYVLDGEYHNAGFGIIAYGKLGGLELSYGSDLDLVFLHDSCGTEQTTNGAKPLQNSIFFARLVRRLVLFLTTQTGSGSLYEVDTRLRPDGHSGLLVTSADAFERYQEENAWTWEHQALLRARPVVGSANIAQDFSRVRAETLTQRVRRDTLQDDVASMRQRMRKQLDKSDATIFDIKQGRGGIGDIEFIVQFLVLNHADHFAELIEFSDNIRQLDALAAAGCISQAVAARLQEIYKNYRFRLHRLILDETLALVETTEFSDERTYVAEIWDSVFSRIKES